MTYIISERKIKEEILNLLRNSDLIPNSVRGVTTENETINVTSTISYIELLKNSVKNIRSIKKNSIPLKLGLDYDINIYGVSTNLNNRIDFKVDLVDGDIIEVDYDYTSTLKNSVPIGDRIYADFPQEFISTIKYPRIGFEIDTTSARPRDIQHKLVQKTFIFSFGVFAPNKDIDNLYESTNEVIRLNRKNLYYINLLVENGRSPKETTPNTNNTITQLLFGYEAPLEFQKE
jgi:hypothetical protein